MLSQTRRAQSPPCRSTREAVSFPSQPSLFVGCPIRIRPLSRGSLPCNRVGRSGAADGAAMIRSSNEIAVRQAVMADGNAVCAIDTRVFGRDERHDFLRSAIAHGECLVAEIGRETAGFAVVDRSLYDQRFVALLIVDPAYQRRGVGSS